MNTKFVKVGIEERKPTENKYYLCLVANGNSGLYCHNSMFDTYKGITHWLEESPDNTDQLMELIQDCKTQLEYLNEKQERGTTNNLLSRLETILKD